MFARHGDLSKPSNNAKGRIRAIQLWDELSNVLNSDGTGDTKTPEKWKKAARIYKAAGGMGGGPANFSKLTDLEQRVLNISGHQSATGLPIEEEVVVPDSLPLDLETQPQPTSQATSSPIMTIIEIGQNESEKLHGNKYICGKHFRPSDFKKKKTQLRRNAIPSLLITAKPLLEDILTGFRLHIFGSSKADHFTSALKSSILTRLSIPVSRGSNCEQDDNEILFDFHDIVFLKKDKKATGVEQRKKTVVESTVNTNFPELHLPEDFDCEIEEMEKTFKNFDKQPTVYVSGYLAKVLLKGVKCQECINAMKVDNPKPNSIYNYIALKEWWAEKISFTYPSIQLCDAVDTATKQFDMQVKSQIYEKNIPMPVCNYNHVCWYKLNMDVQRASEQDGRTIFKTFEPFVNSK
ncbi:hypothetical protein JYU34_015096 [Plutella xylostella]|uniref:Regulatory protein zeste n=1 Tax=Plutella xylostella TaxID=51655 RepID=A0ABQ7Q6B8_PLUXY|nr:hypothetical protein JYU34_015096 [Plutella xylostella]